MNRKELQVVELLSPTVESLGCSIWGVEYLSQGRHSKLRLYIDREGGVDVDNCAEISRHVSDLLDVEEFNQNTYTLEVSSPGMDRILFHEEQYQDYVGAQIEARLNFPFEGKKKYTGQLAGMEDHNVVLRVDDEEYLLPIENIQKARVIPAFE